MNVNYYFNDFEKEYVNRLCKGKKITECSREDILSDLDDGLLLASGGDSELLSFVNNLINKFKNMSDGEWDALKLLIPFTLSDNYDNEEDNN